MHWFCQVKSYRINVYFLFYVFWLCNDSSFFNIVFIFSLITLQNICLNNSKKILNNLPSRISINMLNICLIISADINYSLIICINFLSFFKILTVPTELNLINFIFLYLITRESELMSTKAFFVTIFIWETLIDFKFLLKTTWFIKITIFE